jgi:DNA modification methylase
MPTLDWIGKQAVVNHHREVPYRLVHCDSDLSAGDPDAGNLLVQGDNLEALRALLPYYAGQVKCIYIDPPYNTGNEGWVYNDNVNSPEIKAWLDTVVGKEGEDLSRHDKWLCMMYPRLRLLREFLREDGVVFISIDDNEVANLKTILDELFGAHNWVGTLIWKNATDNNPTNIAVEHEYITAFAAQKKSLEPIWKSAESPVRERIIEEAERLARQFGSDEPSLKSAYRTWFRENKPFLWPFQEYDEIDLHGVFTGSRSVHNPGRDGYFYDILHPTTGKATKKPLMGYRFPEDTRDRLLDEGRFIFGSDENKIVELKVYIDEWKGKLASVYELDGRRGANELRGIFPERKKTFDNPKPVELVSDILSFATERDDLILDSFAGSGTTGQAVLELNKQDGGNRRFILVEMDPAISKDVTAERLRRVIDGYDKGGDRAKPVEGLGGGFRFCRLGKPLFDEFGDVAAEVTFPDLAAHIFFSETGVPIPHKAKTELLGVFRDRAVYLLFDSAHTETPREAAGNVLTPDRLDGLPPPPEGFDGLSVVYAEGCTVSAGRLKAAGVLFKQIPYQIDGV